MKSERVANLLTGVFRRRFSFQTQITLIFALCLGLVGTVVVFFNAHAIARRKDEMKAQAVLLAEELGRRVTSEINTLLEEQGGGSLDDLRGNRRFLREVELVLKGDNKVVSVSLADADGRVVFSSSGTLPEIRTAGRDGEHAEVDLDTRGMQIDQIRLLRTLHNTQRKEFEIQKEGASLGTLQFLMSESAIYRDIEAASREISRLLWSVLLAFVGVLALALYMIARLFRRHVQVLSDNERLDRMAYLGTLASGLAHEIRNPLNAMSVNLSVAKEEIDAGENGSSPMLTDALDTIRLEVGRLNRSVTNFMAFAHPSASRRRKVDLHEVVEEVLDLLHPQIEKEGVDVEVALPDPAELEVDFSGLRQALYNVVLNGIQAIAGDSRPDPPARRIAIGGRRESAQWFLWIEDSGPGLASGQEETVFEAFHTTKAAGSGLGLPIARAIVEANEGDIVARQGESGGTRIEIVLPETGKRSAPPFGIM
ncbi:hypothetical protein JW916_07300 [Candidatus Sumerlaeota bacterium]|nr:hypothetical protein [Candidatus Sumerlaeota bacterium]